MTEIKYVSHLSMYTVEKSLDDSLNLVRDTSGNLKVVKSYKCSEQHYSEVKAAIETLFVQLRHEFVVDLEAVHHGNDTLYTIYDYCEGGSLNALLKRARQYDEVLNEMEVIDWLIQITTALQHLHSRGIVYGSLNPKNILLHNNCAYLSSSKVVARVVHQVLSSKDGCKAEKNNCADVVSSSSAISLERSAPTGRENLIHGDNDIIVSCASSTTDVHSDAVSELSAVAGKLSLSSNVCGCDDGSSKGKPVTDADAACHVPFLNLTSYLSPQLGRCRSNAYMPTPADDMWAVGCVLYEMCSRHKLFPKSSSSPDVAAFISSKVANFPDVYPIELQQIWIRLMDCDPDKRPTAKDLLAADFVVEHNQWNDDARFNVEPEEVYKRLETNCSRSQPRDEYYDLDTTTGSEDADLMLTADDVNELLSSL